MHAASSGVGQRGSSGWVWPREPTNQLSSPPALTTWLSLAVNWTLVTCSEWPVYFTYFACRACVCVCVCVCLNVP